MISGWDLTRSVVSDLGGGSLELTDVRPSPRYGSSPRRKL